MSLSPELVDGVGNLNERDRQELNTFIQQETQKAQIQGTIHALTDTCFKKCITGKISSGNLDRTEEPCMRNCVDRYMDANMQVIKHLEQMRSL